MPRWWSRNCGALCPGREFFGCTGPRLRAAGVRTVVDAASLAVVGLLEVVSHIPRIYGEYRKLLAAAADRRARILPFSPIPRIFTCAWPASCIAQGFRWFTWSRPRPGHGARAASAKCAAPYTACCASFLLKRSSSPGTGCGPPISATLWPGWYAHRLPGGVFSETQAGCGPSINYSAARKPPGRISAPLAGAAGRGAADLPGAGHERRVAGLGDYRGSVFQRASGPLADSGDRRGKLGRHGARRSRARCKRNGHRGSGAAGHPHGHVL